VVLPVDGSITENKAQVPPEAVSRLHKAQLGCGARRNLISYHLPRRPAQLVVVADGGRNARLSLCCPASLAIEANDSDNFPLGTLLTRAF
jgi:hypothetical protein